MKTMRSRDYEIRRIEVYIYIFFKNVGLVEIGIVWEDLGFCYISSINFFRL